MKTKFLISLFLLPLILCGVAFPAWATINGSVEWNYTDYEIDRKKGEDHKANSFFQRYSVMYRKAGILGSSRLGSWNLGLGAEWAAFDTELDDKTYDADSFKVLYNGDLLVAPGALPFRLHAFSYDLSPITTLRDSISGIPTPYFRPGLATDLRNGQTIYSGFTLAAGIRNGSYMGRYRDTMSKLPRLLVDYRDLYHRDIDAINPSKYRQRDLAFVSLNKKDNWFHYRVYDYKDYMDSRQDSREETFLLGTIDHMLKRKWIHLTNWLNISADGSYTTINDQPGLSESNRYDVNLFSTMRRHHLSASNFTHYSRERQGARITQTLDVPVFLNNRISPDANMRGQVLVNRWEEKENTQVRRNEDVYFSQAKYESRITRSTRLDYNVQAEYNDRENGSAQGLQIDVEAFSNIKYRSRLDWYGNLGIARYDGDAFDGSNTDYWEGFGSGRVNYLLARGLRLGASQEIVVGSGSIGSYTTSFIAPRSTRGFTYVQGEVRRESDYFRTQTGLSLEHVGRNRMTNRLAGLYKYEEDSEQSNWSFELEHRLTYNLKSFSMDMANQFSTGDIFSNSDSGTSGLGAYQEIRSPDDIFKHHTLVKYQPNKYWEATGELDVEWRQGQSARDDRDKDTTLIMFTQKLRRNFYAINGVIRKLADIQQRIDYEKFMDGFDNEVLRFTLAGNYYPTKQLSFGGSFLYRYHEYGRDDMTLRFTSGVHFPKFQVDFNYDYGTDEDRETVVQRYEVNVRKTF